MLHATSKFLSFSALAFAVLSGPSFAETSCDLSDGYGLTPAAFLEEADSCLEGVEGIKTDTFTSTELSRLASDQRNANGLDQVEALDSLSEAARLHAYDLAFRGYAAHEDLEGRTHLDRVRMIDRSHLISSFGANVVVVKAGTSPEAIQKVLLADRANASNFKRGEFNHMGIAAVEADGMIYVVELFARVDGQLDTPMPMTAVPRMNLAANFGDKLEPVGWSVVSASGQTLMRGLGNKLPSTLPYIEEGFLQMDVEIGKDVYTLKGPAISSSL
ncbi:MAG: hypothetical protein VR75_06455 [Hyphomonadaceae bacterium BRH_c29]|jgi:hypothetical protein|nr:MAG: hypothetical protein VR75_06455 [Hyphomonadaceae bacterium BRH_c29]